MLTRKTLTRRRWRRSPCRRRWRARPYPRRSGQGDDGVLLDGEQRGLDADEDDLCGDDEEDGGEDGEDDDGGALDEPGGVEAVELHLAVVVEVGDLDAQDPGEAEGQPAGDLGGEPVQGDGLPGGVKGALEGREAAPEVAPRGQRDDDVDPCGAELDERKAGEQGGDGGEEAAERGGEEAHEGRGGEALGDEAEEAAEVGAEAAVGEEQAVHGAEGRRDGARLAVGGLAGAALLLGLGLDVGGVVVEREGLVGRGFSSSTMAKMGKTVLKVNEDDKVDEEDENGPAGEVIFGHVVVAGTDGAADGSPDVRELHGVEVSLE
ncbi:hypothetical protein ACCO45_011263 [Purpureocillium lilacinum]|uniref:Uncharacterized protein n=1 Tax=Purpureocillium lilacinum TaxID=33203 RepID=A0ACC4DK35_PURLI